VVISNTISSTSTTTGTIVLNGGLGVSGNIFAGAIYDNGIEIILHTNSAFTAANSAGVYANSAFSSANFAFLAANTADAKAVTAGSYANSAFASANLISGVNTTQNTNITNAGTYANAAFAQANTDFTNISISPSQTYGNSGYYPVITISANGRINAVSTQVVTDPSAIAFAIALG
jgi:hypothetical protein